MFQFTHAQELEPYRGVLESLARQNNTEYNPPLENRNGITSLEYNNAKDLDKYIDDCAKRKGILAKDENESVLAILIYEEDYESEELPSYQPSTLLGTVLLNEEEYKEDLFEELMNEFIQTVNELETPRFILTQTWETNSPTRTRLEELDFDLIHRVRNDRPDGDDTIWYAYRCD